MSIELHPAQDSPSFSTVEYINATFPSEQSLNNLDDVMAEMRFKVQCVDDDIRDLLLMASTTFLILK